MYIYKIFFNIENIYLYYYIEDYLMINIECNTGDV